jgi:hypothetical protein
MGTDIDQQFRDLYQQQLLPKILEGIPAQIAEGKDPAEILAMITSDPYYSTDALAQVQAALAGPQAQRQQWIEAASGGLVGGTTPAPSTAAGAEQAVRQLAGNIYTNNVGRLSPYPGAAPIGPSAETQLAQSLALDGGATQQGIAQGANTALQTAFAAPDVANNPHLQAAIQSGMRRLQDQTYNAGGVMSQIRSQAGQVGQVGSSRQGVAEGLAAQGLQQASGDLNAKMMMEAYGQGLDTSIRGLALAPQVQGTQMAQAQTVGAVGQQKEQYAMDQANYGTDQKLWDMNAPWQNLGNYANLVYGNPAAVLPGQTNDPKMSSSQRNATMLGTGVGAYFGGSAGAALGGSLAGALFGD